MMKTIKKSLALLLCAVLALGPAAIGREDITGLLSVKAKAAAITSYKAGDVIELGSYPQSRVTDESIISALNKSGGTWISYDYYTGRGWYDGKMAPSDIMLYKDVTYDSVKYRGVSLQSYRPAQTGEPTSDGMFQRQNGFYVGGVYWFRYDPLKWTVLDPAGGTVMSETVLDAQPFSNYVLEYNIDNVNYSYWGDAAKTYPANDYGKSSIREWLNDDFYNTAFSAEQKSAIDTAVVDNDFPQYASGSTNDKIYLLREEDIGSIDGSVLSAQNTDYANCQGAGEDEWLLRTPVSDLYCGTVSGGRFYGEYNAVNQTYGIRPAMSLKLNANLTPFGNSELLEENTILYMDADNGLEKINCYRSLEDTLPPDSGKYSPELAAMLMGFSVSAYDKDCIYNSLLNFGFDKESVELGSAYTRGEAGRTAYSIAVKEMTDGRTLVFVPVRGAVDTAEQISDLSSDNAGLYSVFSAAADEVINHIKQKFGSAVPTDAVYVLTGYSRGAAAANLAAKKLIDAGVSTGNVYDYNFGCPDVVHYSAYTLSTLYPVYDSIFNINNGSDTVSYMPNHALNFVEDKAGFYKDWGKFGKTYRFTEEDWFGTPGIGISAHGRYVYLNYMQNNYPIDRCCSLAETKNRIYGSPEFTESAKDWLLIGIYCPVSAKVLCEGEVIASVNDDASVCEGNADYSVFIFKDGDKKIITFPNNGLYQIRLTGTADGKMDYFVRYYEFLGDEPAKEYSYRNIALKMGREFEGTAGTEEMISRLFVLDRYKNPVKEIMANGSEVEYTEGSIRAFSGTKTVDYRESVRIYAEAENVADGYSLAIFDGSAIKARAFAGADGTVSLRWISEELKGNKTYSVRLIDENGKTLSGGSGELKKEIKVEVNDSFFRKLIAFFKGLFNRNAVIDIGLL